MATNPRGQHRHARGSRGRLLNRQWMFLPAPVLAVSQIRFDALPEDVLAIVAGMVYAEGSISALASVNRTLRYVATPLLFKSIKCVSFLGLLSLFYLGQSPLSSCIQEIHIECPNLSVLDATNRNIFVLELGRMFMALTATAIPAEYPQEFMELSTAICHISHMEKTLPILKLRTRISYQPAFEGYKMSIGDRWDTHIDLLSLYRQCYVAAYKLALEILLPQLPLFTSFRLVDSDTSTESPLTSFLPLHKVFNTPTLAKLSLTNINLRTRHSLSYPSITSLDLEYLDQVGQPSHLRQLFKTVRPILKSLRFLHRWRKMSDEEHLESNIEIIEESIWPALEELTLRFIDDSEEDVGIDLDYPVFLISNVMRCPNLKALDTNCSAFLTILHEMDGLKMLTCPLFTNMTDWMLDWMEDKQSLQQVNLLIKGCPLPVFLGKLFRSLSHVQDIALRLSGLGLDFQTSFLVDAFLMADRSCLSPVLEKLRIQNYQDHKIYRWHTYPSALQRLFPSIQTFGNATIGESINLTAATQEFVHL